VTLLPFEDRSSRPLRSRPGGAKETEEDHLSPVRGAMFSISKSKSKSISTQRILTHAKTAKTPRGEGVNGEAMSDLDLGWGRGTRCTEGWGGEMGLCLGVPEALRNLAGGDRAPEARRNHRIGRPKERHAPRQGRQAAQPGRVMRSQERGLLHRQSLRGLRAFVRVPCFPKPIPHARCAQDPKTQRLAGGERALLGVLAIRPWAWLAGWGCRREPGCRR